MLSPLESVVAVVRSPRERGGVWPNGPVAEEAAAAPPAQRAPGGTAAAPPGQRAQRTTTTTTRGAAACGGRRALGGEARSWKRAERRLAAGAVQRRLPPRPLAAVWVPLAPPQPGQMWKEPPLPLRPPGEPDPPWRRRLRRGPQLLPPPPRQLVMQRVGQSASGMAAAAAAASPALHWRAAAARCRWTPAAPP